MSCTSDGIEIPTGFWWESLKEGGYLEIVVVHGSVVLIW
jgi:hypothetical protein